MQLEAIVLVFFLQNTVINVFKNPYINFGIGACSDPEASELDLLLGFSSLEVIDGMPVENLDTEMVCRQNQFIARVYFNLSLIFLLHIYQITGNRGIGSQNFNKYYMAKYGFLPAATLVSCCMPNFMFTIFYVCTLPLGILFLGILFVFLIDFTYSLHESWIIWSQEQEGELNQKVSIMTLLGCSGVILLLSFYFLAEIEIPGTTVWRWTVKLVLLICAGGVVAYSVSDACKHGNLLVSSTVCLFSACTLRLSSEDPSLVFALATGIATAHHFFFRKSFTRIDVYHILRPDPIEDVSEADFPLNSLNEPLQMDGLLAEPDLPIATIPWKNALWVNLVHIYWICYLVRVLRIGESHVNSGIICCLVYLAFYSWTLMAPRLFPANDFGVQEI
jgi:hypothetical protein